MRQSDYITLHVSLTPDTEKMLSAEAFAQMKNGVRIVNCARGELMDDAALQAAIESGKVAGAALDVFTMEPTTRGVPAVRAGTQFWRRRISPAPPKKRRRSWACASPSRWWST